MATCGELPAALGAKLAAPGRPVVCMIGDGGLQFTLPELATAVEQELPVLVLSPTLLEIREQDAALWS